MAAELDIRDRIATDLGKNLIQYLVSEANLLHDFYYYYRNYKIINNFFLFITTF